jgi:hypothetical protein
MKALNLTLFLRKFKNCSGRTLILSHCYPASLRQLQVLKELYYDTSMVKVTFLAYTKLLLSD